MRRFAVVLSLLIAASVAAEVAYTGAQSQVLAGVTPTLATQGAPLSSGTGYRVVFEAPSGQTISGCTGQCYFYSNSVADWIRCPTSLDITISTGARRASSGDFVVAVGAGRIYYKLDSCTLSGAGTALNVYYEIQRR